MAPNVELNKEFGNRVDRSIAGFSVVFGASSPCRPIAGPFNSVPKHVATHHSDSLDWQNSHALEGDLADAIRALEHQDGPNLLTHGNPSLNSDPACLVIRSLSTTRFFGSAHRLGAGGAG